MNKLIFLAAILGIALTLGTAAVRADGGETGASASHTQSSWQYTSPYGR